MLATRRRKIISTCMTSGGTVASFTPASVPGIDFWIEADPAKLYSDNGITPIVANDPVYLAKDKSAAGRDASSPTLARRPIYKTDLSKPSLLFDATDDCLAGPSDISQVDGSGQCWFAISLQITSLTNLQEPMTITSGLGYLADIYVGAGGSLAHMEVRNAAGSFEEDTQGTIVAGTPLVIIGTITSTAAEIFINNVSGGSTALTGTRRTEVAQLFVGSNATTHPLGGRVFGAIHGTGPLSSSDRANLQTYLAALHP